MDRKYTLACHVTVCTLAGSPNFSFLTGQRLDFHQLAGFLASRTAAFRGCEKIDYAVCNILKNKVTKLPIRDFFTTS